MGFSAYARATAEAAATREAESSMAGAFAALTAEQQREATARALAVLSREQPPPSHEQQQARPSGSEAVFLVRDVLSSSECAAVLTAVRCAVKARGGWASRHHTHRTADLGLGAVPEVEALLRARLFSRVLRPLVAEFFCHEQAAAPMLPEQLRFNDVFFVRYSAEEEVSAWLGLGLGLGLGLLRALQRLGGGACRYRSCCAATLP